MLLAIFPNNLTCFDELLYLYIVCCYMCVCSTFLLKTEAISCGLNTKHAKMNDAKENLPVTARQKGAHEFSYVKSTRET